MVAVVEVVVALATERSWTTAHRCLVLQGYTFHGVINLPNGDRRQGSAPNIVIFFPSINRIFITRIIIFIS
jgi:hypothetical protein